MDTAVRPFKTEQLQHLKKLGKVQLLLGPDHVQCAVEPERLIAVDGRGQVPGNVKGGSVLFAQHTRGQAVFLQVDDQSTLALPGDALLPDQPDSILQHIVIVAFAVVVVKADPQQAVDLLVAFQAQFAEAAPVLRRLAVPLLQALEPAPGLLLQLRLLPGFPVKADVELEQVIDRVRPEGTLLSPAAEGHDNLAELGAPVAEMVDPHAAIAQGLENQVEGVTDHRRAQMSDAERLGNVGRGEVDHHGASRARR